MKKILRIELRRAFKSKSLYVAITIGIILCVWLLGIELAEVHNFEQIIAKYGIEKVGLYYPRSLFNSFIGLEFAYLPSTILYAIFPILVSFPYAMSYYSDKKSGYIKNILLRCSRKDYYTAKYISVFISGAFVVFVVLGFSLLISALFFPAIPPELTTYSFSPQNETQMWTKLFTSYPMIYTVLYCLIDIIFYALIATISLCMGLFVKNGFTVVSVPMLVYIIVQYVSVTLGLDTFSPMSFLRPCQIFSNASFVIIAVMAAIISVLTITCFIIFGGKRDVL